MAILVGDIHGNVEKVRAFLDYKPDEIHVALGDYLDSFFEPQFRQLEALQLLLDSSAILLWGNHDVHYLKTPPWICTGFQYGKEKPLQAIIGANKDRFLAAYAVDGWLCTHAGVHIRVARPKRCGGDVVMLADKFNADMQKYLKKPETYQRINSISPSPPIFNIGQGRGGNSRCAGIFWFDYRRESGLAHVNQIFGHTEGKKTPVHDKTRVLGEYHDYVCLDTTNNKTECWLYDTGINELVCLPTQRQCEFSLLPAVGLW